MNQDISELVKRPQYTCVYIALLCASIIISAYSLVAEESEFEMLMFGSIAVFITTLVIGMCVESRKDTSILTLVAMVGSMVCTILVSFSPTF